MGVKLYLRFVPTFTDTFLLIFFDIPPFEPLSDPITQKTSRWKVVALCINKVLFMSQQSDNSLTDVNVICTVLWPTTASSSSPVIDKGAPSVTEPSLISAKRRTVNSLMHRRGPGTADHLQRVYDGPASAHILISFWNSKVIGLTWSTSFSVDISSGIQ